MKYSFSTSDSGDIQRITSELTGIRLIFNTEGIGYKVTVENLILQIANFFALMLIPRLLADLILIYLLKYQDYSGYKYENTLNQRPLDDFEENSSQNSQLQREEEKKQDESESSSLLRDLDSN